MGKYAHELAVSDPIEPRRFTVSSLMNQQRLFAQEDFHPRYLPNERGEAEMVHPALVIQMLANTSSPSYRVPENIGTVLSEAQTQFIRPLRVGEEYVTAWQIARIYVKRGRPYQEIKAEITDADGHPVVRRTLHVTYVERST
jgi:hypothetical protein